MRIELADCQRVLLDEIAEPKYTHTGIAATYAMAICSSDTVDWKAVNRAIVKRWSISELMRIKRQAWRLIDESKSRKT